MLDREKLRRRVEQASARDDTRRRHWAQARERRIERGMEDPLLPQLIRLCLIGMIAGAFMAFTGDLAARLRGGGGFSLRALQSPALSALGIWLLFGIPLIFGCAMQLRRGFDHPWFERHGLRRNGQPRMPWGKKYRLWIGVAATGVAALLVLYILSSAI